MRFFGPMLSFVLSLAFVIGTANAQSVETPDVMFYGVELEKLLNLGGGVLSTVLFTVTLLAYRRSRNGRLAYVAAAFLMFAAKGFMISSEIWFDEWPLVDLVASGLDFAILLSFFFGIVKK